LLNYQPTHAVRHDRQRSIVREGRDIEPRTEVDGKDGEVGIRRPDTAYIGQQARAVPQTENIPVVQRGFSADQGGEEAPGILLVSRETMNEKQRGVRRAPSSDFVDAMAR